MHSCVHALRACAVQQGEPAIATGNQLPAARSIRKFFAIAAAGAPSQGQAGGATDEAAGSCPIIASNAGHGTSMPCRRPFSVSFNLCGPAPAVGPGVDFDFASQRLSSFVTLFS
jgi:hypothetical protein